MSILTRISLALEAAAAPDWRAVHRDLGNGVRRYRVKRVRGGWEPQMLYTTGRTNRAVWFPLNADGYWAEPEAFEAGAVQGRHPLTHDAALRSVLCAKRINEDAQLRAVPDHILTEGGEG